MTTITRSWTNAQGIKLFTNYTRKPRKSLKLTVRRSKKKVQRKPIATLPEVIRHRLLGTDLRYAIFSHLATRCRMLTSTEIADTLGVRRSSVCRILKLLTDNHLIVRVTGKHLPKQPYIYETNIFAQSAERRYQNDMKTAQAAIHA